MEQSRRNILQTGAGLVSAGVLSSLAGCGALQDAAKDATSSVTGGGSGFYKSWLADPDAVELDDHYYFSALKPVALDENDEYSDSDSYESLESSFDSSFNDTGLDIDEAEEWISMANGNIDVITGSFTQDDIEDELDDADYEDEEELDSGEVVYLNGGNRTAFGVSSDYVIRASSSQVTSSSDSDSDTLSAPSAGDSVTDDVRSISYGNTVVGRVDDSDPTDSSGYYGGEEYEPITFQGSEGEVIDIRMACDEYPEMTLEDPDGEEVATDNYSYGSDNYTISDHTLQQSGEYTIKVKDYVYTSTGTEYRLKLELVYSPDDLVDSVETLAGVQSGDTDLYTDESDAASDLIDELGGGDLLTGETYEEKDADNPENGDLEDSVAKGLSFTLNGEQFDVKGVVVYDSDSDYDDGDIEDWADEGTSLANEELDDIEVSQKGRVGVFNAVVDADDLV